MSDQPDLLFIDGEWREANDGRRFEVEDPADGSVLARVADAHDARSDPALGENLDRDIDSP